MAPAVPSTDIVRWLLSYFGHRQDDRNRGVFAISDHTKLIPWLSNINEGWRWHRYHTLARFGRTFVWRDLFTDLTAGEAMVRTSSPRELTAGSRIQHCTHSKKIYVPNLPVELAHFEQLNCLLPSLYSNLYAVTREEKHCIFFHRVEYDILLIR